MPERVDHVGKNFLSWDGIMVMERLSDCCYMMMKYGKIPALAVHCWLFWTMKRSNFDLGDFLVKYHLDFFCFLVKLESSIPSLFHISTLTFVL